MQALDFVLKLLGFAMEITIVLAWLYAYRKTGMKGFVFIALSTVLGPLGWLIFSLLIVTTPLSFVTLRYTILPAFGILSFIVLLYGIRSLVGEIIGNP